MKKKRFNATACFYLLPVAALLAAAFLCACTHATRVNGTFGEKYI